MQSPRKPLAGVAISTHKTIQNQSSIYVDNVYAYTTAINTASRSRKFLKFGSAPLSTFHNTTMSAFGWSDICLYTLLSHTLPNNILHIVSYPFAAASRSGVLSPTVPHVQHVHVDKMNTISTGLSLIQWICTPCIAAAIYLHLSSLRQFLFLVIF